MILLDIECIHVVAGWETGSDVALDANEVLVYPAEVVQECAWVLLVPLVAGIECKLFLRWLW